MQTSGLIQSYQTRIETFLLSYFDNYPQIPASRLLDAIKYSMLNGGKRIRPLLVYASGQLFNAPLSQLDSAAAAIEMIHTYSLIHDDLPEMDNDDIRRGKPSCHKQFDCATALLAGDCLQTMAFEIIVNETYISRLPAAQTINMVKIISYAIGIAGMAGGQSLDLMMDCNQTHLNPAETILDIHLRKTAALIKAAILCGACAANATLTEHTALNDVGELFGLAFQLQDDLLDYVDGGCNEPCNIVPHWGKQATQEKINECYQRACDLLHPYGQNAQPLLTIANYLLQRTY
ncbi:MAG: (2E,6E)-farnesyl diphosphate synthase [Gammaproteobacteria bacterium]